VNLDKTGWFEIGGRLEIPDNVSLLLAPRYSQELNPIELANSIHQPYEAIVDAGCAG
jgi:hypothetical protein